MKKITYLFTALFMVAFSWQGMAQVGGDDCATAEIITPGTFIGTTITDLTGGASQGDAADAKWFSYTPGADGTIDVSSCLGGSDTRLWIWDGTCGALGAVADNDDFCEMTSGGNAYASEVTGVPVTSGTEYFIEWDDRWEEGPFDWSLTYTPPPACAEPNTLAVSAIVLGTGTDGTATVSWVDGNAPSIGFEWELVDITGGGSPTGTGTSTTDLFVDLIGLTLGSEYQLLVRADCNFGSFSTWASINWTMIGPPTCTELPIVPADAATGVSFGSTLLSWTEDTSGGEAPTGYQIWFGQTSGALNNLGTIAAPATGVNITGILANTTYYWRIVPENAGGEATGGCAEYSYTTKDYPAVAVGVDCSASGNDNNNVLTEEFDAQGLWTGTFNGGGGTWILPQSGATGSTDTGPDAAHSGSNYMFYEASGGGARASAVTPAIDLTAATGGAELSFFMHAFGYEMGTFEVGVSTAGAGGPFTNEFTWDGAMQVSGAEAWRQVGVNLDTYVGQTIHIEIANTGSGVGFHGDVAIDLFNVETCLTVSCPAPVNLAVTNIDATDVDISWDVELSAVGYDWEIQPAGNVQGDPGAINSGNTTSNSVVNVSGPFPSGGYTLFVRSDCGLSQSTYSNVAFSTPFPGENCGLAEVITPGTFTGTVIQSGTGGATDPGRDAHWFSYTATGDGTIDVSSCIDTNDTRLFIYDGTCGTLNQLGTSDDDCGLASEVLGTPVVNGTEYFIEWDDRWSEGPFNWELVFTPTPTCIEPINLAVANLTTTNADLSWDPEATETGGYNWEIHIVPGVAGVDAPLYSGSTLTGVTTANSVGPFVAGTTNYTLYVQTNCGFDGVSTWGSVGFALPFGGDDCANATIITPGSFTGTTINDLTGGASQGDAADAAWFSYTPPTFGAISVNSCATTSDTRLHIHDGTCAALNLLETDDDDCASGLGSEIIDLPVIGGSEYFIEWDDRWGEGPFDWELVFTPTCAGITTTWDGAVWDNGAPTSNDVAVINGLYQTSVGDIEACVISINATHSIVVEAGGYVRAQNDIYVAGDLFVLHEGSVVQVDDAAATVKIGAAIIDVQKITPLLTDADFTILGSPMTGETREGVYAAAAIVRHHVTGNFVPFANGVPAADNWADDNGDNWLTHTGALSPGAGYLVKPQLTGAGTPAAFQTNYFEGTLNNGIVTVPTILNAGGPDESPNIIGNPYASAISINSFLTGNIDAGGAVYFWEHATAPAIAYPGYYTANYDMGDISSHNGTIGTAAANAPGNVPTNEMPSGQGFGVKVTLATDITFNNAMRVTGPNTGYRNSQIVDELHLTVSNDAYNLNGSMALGFTDFTSEAIERSDIKRLATSISLFSVVDDMELGIQMRSVLTEDQVVPLGFHTFVDENQTYTISLGDVEGELISNANVFLQDNLLNTVTNLSETDYTFIADVGYQSNRFVLVFEMDVLGNQDLSLDAVSIYPVPTASLLTINSPLAKVNTVAIHDISGRQVAFYNFTDQNSYQMDVTSLDSAVYFVEINTDNGSVTRRIIKE